MAYYDARVPEMWVPDDICESEFLYRVILIGEHLARVCEAAGQPVAALRICDGLEILRADADLKASLHARR